MPKPGPELGARVLADQRTALIGVLPREQHLERNIAAVAVTRVAVCERELRRLRRDVHELGLAERGDVEAFEQAQLLQRGRPLSPRPRLAHREAAIVDRRRRLETRAPRGEVVARQQPTLLAREAIDLLRDEARVVDISCALDLLLARAAARFRDQ